MEQDPNYQGHNGKQTVSELDRQLGADILKVSSGRAGPDEIPSAITRREDGSIEVTVSEETMIRLFGDGQ